MQNKPPLYPWQQEVVDSIHEDLRLKFMDEAHFADPKAGIEAIRARQTGRSIELQQEMLRQLEDAKKPFRIQYNVDAENNAEFFKGKCSLCNRPILLITRNRHDDKIRNYIRDQVR